MDNEKNIQNEGADPIGSTPESIPAETEAKKKERRGVPVWALIVSIFLAALISFQATFVVMAGKYGGELNIFRAQRSTVSADLGKVYALIDEISAIFESKGIYDVDYDELIENLVYDYIYETNDPYAMYYTAQEWDEETDTSEGNSAGIGILVIPLGVSVDSIIVDGLYISRVMKDGPADNAGVRKGDVLVAIDGKSIVGMDYNSALGMAVGEKGSTVKLTVLRDGIKTDFDVVRGDYTYDTVEYHVIEKDGVKIGYINISEFYEITVSQFENAVTELKAAGCKGLVYDVRDNPGGFLTSIYNILDYILPSGPVVRITYVDGSEQTLSSDHRCISDMPMAVLANGNTASAAELFTSALKDYNYATVVGTTTYGKGCGQDIFALSNGGYLKLTTFYYSPPYSDNFDGVGVTPDVEVKLEGEAAKKNSMLLTEEEDTQLAKAIEIVLSKIN